MGATEKRRLQEHKNAMIMAINSLICIDCHVEGHKLGERPNLVNCTDDIHLAAEAFIGFTVEKLGLSRCQECGHVSQYPWVMEDGLCFSCHDLPGLGKKGKVREGTNGQR